MSDNSMIRSVLPLAWIALIGSTTLLYSLPANDPVWGEVIDSFRKWPSPVPVLILLTLIQ